MKNFIDICKMSQNELKRYLQKYMGSKKYATFNGDGYLLCRPRGNTIPVLLVAHMDTVFPIKPKKIYYLHHKELVVMIGVVFGQLCNL